MGGVSGSINHTIQEWLAIRNGCIKYYAIRLHNILCIGLLTAYSHLIGLLTVDTMSNKKNIEICILSSVLTVYGFVKISFRIIGNKISARIFFKK